MFAQATLPDGLTGIAPRVPRKMRVRDGGLRAEDALLPEESERFDDSPAERQGRRLGSAQGQGHTKRLLSRTVLGYLGFSALTVWRPSSDTFTGNSEPWKCRGSISGP